MQAMNTPVKILRMDKLFNDRMSLSSRSPFKGLF
jgi:hypothetical protein